MADMKIPQRITDLSRKDFEEIVRATNLKPGLGINIEPADDGIKISINESQLKQMLWAFNQNGGFNAAASDVEGVSFDMQS